MTDFDPEQLDDAAVLGHLARFVGAIEASGFVRSRDEAHVHPTWLRSATGLEDLSEPSPDDGVAPVEKLVVWRHPRQLHVVHAYAAISSVQHMVHLRLFDPEWNPARILPGHIDKGWTFGTAQSLRSLDAQLTDVIWPRVLAWYAEPIEPDALMMEHGRVPSVLVPGAMLERHRKRATWLEAQGRDEEAAWVRGMVAEIEALYDEAR